VTGLWRDVSDLGAVATVLGVVVGGGVFLGSWAYRGAVRTPSAVWRSVGEALVAAWGIALLAVMLRPLPYPTEPGPDLVPLAGVSEYLGAASWQGPVLQLGGLALLFAAGGGLLAARLGSGVALPVLLVAGSSVLVEVLQHALHTGRHVATDDVLVAAATAALGAAAVVGLRERLGRVRSRRTGRVVAGLLG